MNHIKRSLFYLVSQTGDYEEPDIEADNESQGRKIGCELFCVKGNDSEYADIDDRY